MHSLKFIKPLFLTLVQVVSLTTLARGGQPLSQEPSIQWQLDYHAGMDLAEAQQKLALIWFVPAASAEASDIRRLWAHPEVAAAVNDRVVAIRLPLDIQIPSQGTELKLSHHPAFAELERQPGIAILDLTDRASPHFRQVISIFPFSNRAITPSELVTMLSLPLGSLTQRTLIFAVRMHPDLPESASSHFSPLLASECERHAAHQASLTRQGHHQWESRFHSINAQLPAGLVSQEVCAESWPGQNLLAAAEECVDSWRQSSGHWEAVSRRQVLFGYDMQRGRNGVWYAAGIFAKKP